MKKTKEKKNLTVEQKVDKILLTIDLTLAAGSLIGSSIAGWKLGNLSKGFPNPVKLVISIGAGTAVYYIIGEGSRLYIYNVRPKIEEKLTERLTKKELKNEIKNKKKEDKKSGVVDLDYEVLKVYEVEEAS